MATGGRSDDQHQAMISNAPGSFNEFKTHLDVCRSSSDVSDVGSSASSTFSVRNARVKLELARLKARQEEELSALEDDLRKLRTRHALQAAETESKVWEMSDDKFLRWVTVDRIRHDNSVKTRDFPPKSQLIDNGRENTPRRLPTHTADSSSANPVPPRLNHALHRRTVDLPKPEIAKFSGDPMEYYSFIRNFKAHVTDLVDDDNVRLSYLLQLCQGEAKNAIDHCSMMEPSRGYREAMRELKNEYGKDHVISRTCLDRLKRGPKLNFDDAKGQSITHEKLETLLVEVESKLNSRPITPVIMDHSADEPLTPNHLLLVVSSPNVSPGVFTKRDCYVRQRWRQVQYLADEFWHRWIKEYLPTGMAKTE
ncbi:uncharacterized protein LOC144428197 [Styela clava]